jgi:hypothetical protein
MRTIFAVLVGIAAISACSSAGGSSTSVEVSDSAGVKIVRSHEPTWGEGEAWLVSSEPQVTIGVFDGPREYELFDVSAAARQTDGDFVVVDGGAREVRLYDRDGTFLKTLGGPGSGPGEFQDPAQVLITAADSVIVWDNAIYRITRFDSAGEFAGVQSVDRGWIAKAIDAPLYPASAQLLQDDQILVRLVEKTGGYEKTGGVKQSNGFAPGVLRPRSGALRVSADLSRIDTLMFFGDAEQVYVRAPWGQWPVVPALSKRTVTAVGATLSRACIGDQEGPEIICFGPDASRTVIRWTSEPRPVTEQEVATWRDTTIELYTQKISEAEALKVLAQVTVPTVRPHYSSIALDRVGNLWVERGPTNGAATESVDHLVFDPTGALLGVVALPLIEILEIGDDYVMGVYRDEFDIEYLQVHEIVKQPASILDP